MPASAQDSNAQGNRNTWGWGETGAVVLSFIAAVGGATGVSIIIWQRLSKSAAKGKQDDDTLNAVLARFDQLDSGVKVLNEKLTKLEAINLESKINMVSSSLGTIKSSFTEFHSSVKEMDTKLKGYINNSVNELTSILGNKSENEKALNDLNQEVSESLRAM